MKGSKEMPEAGLGGSFFSQGPLFAGLDTSQRALLLASTWSAEVARGEYIFRRGDPGDALYVVESGMLEAVIDDDLPTEQILRLFNPGDYFGEMALLTGESRSASIRARIDSRVVALPKPSFQALLKENPATALHLSAVLCRRLSNMNESLSRRSSRISLVVSMGDEGVASGLAVALVRSLERQLGGSALLVLLGRTLPGLDAGEESPRFEDTLEPGRTLLGRVTCSVVSKDVLATTSEGRVAEALTDLRRRHSHLIVWTNLSVVAQYPAVVAAADEVCLLSCHAEPHRDLSQACEDLANVARGRRVHVAVVEEPEQSRRSAGMPERRCIRLAVRRGDLVMGEPTKANAQLQGGIDRLARAMAGATVGLALSAGGAQGMAHLGVMEALLRAGVPVDLIAGTSAGALYGSMIACGMQISEAQRLVMHRTRFNLIDRADFTFPVEGIIRGGRLERMFREELGDVTFEELDIPFYAIAADLDTGSEVVLDNGLVYQAVRASISIPGAFEPYRLGSRTLVDGAVVDPLPLGVVRERGANFVIAVQVPPARSAQDFSGRSIPHRGARRHNLISTLMRSYYFAADSLANKSALEADVLIKPTVAHFGWRAYRFSREIIQAGREAGADAVKRIAGLLPVALQPPA